MNAEQRAEARRATYARYRQTDGYRQAQERYRAKGKRTENATRWNQANPERHYAAERRYHLKKYGLTPEQFRDHLVGQAARCLICGGVMQGQRDTHVDHDHATGKVRGLLCGPCNRMLGCSRDDPKRLRAGAQYLEAAV